MIDSLEFVCSPNTTNYITEIAYKNVLKRKYKGWSKDDIKKDLQKRKDTERYYRPSIFDYYEEVRDGYKNPQLIKNLLHKKFVFAHDRINVLFGPNGSGKTTIIKAIAANALCGSSMQFDGWSNYFKYKPTDYGLGTDRFSIQALHELINKCAGNDVKMCWDGSPVYYENFSGRINTGSLGDLCGGFINSTTEEVGYILNSKISSQGERSLYLFNKLIDICRRTGKPTYEIPVANETWVNAANVGIKYLSEYKNASYDKKTVLLDEIDKSMDITNIIALYKTVLPDIMRKTGTQFIIVSHSPIMLSNIIQGNDDYNFISIDNEYTDSIKNIFSGICF